ncbi:PIN domain-containing protein [Paraburkholderia sp. J11-2]|uniref:PIN domain-containing protein n=1 Tax=Paraburkholderia sp. J11-2 TaxID=2805431 RepID=UPI002AB7E5EF|nr:PIN domain-containing protein [Paraburkholderia sp. J11-2]
MASSFTAIYDACVLYPAALRNLMMHLALTDLFRARWTDAIHDEWTRNLIEDRPDLDPSMIHRTRDLMDRHVRDAKITGYEPLIPAVQLPDPDDAHVVAAAIHCHASTIVTLNLKDFPSDVLARFGIEVQHPDDFVAGLFNLNQMLVLRAMADHRRSLRNPPKSAYEYLDTLASQGLTQTVSIVRPYVAAI